MTSNEKNTAALLHLSALSQMFIPFGNFIFPIIIWTAKKNDSEFINFNGKQVLNFQLSAFIYKIIALIITIPVLLFTVFKNYNFNSFFNDKNFEFNENFDGGFPMILVALIAIVIFYMFLKLIEFAIIIYAAIKASNGDSYKYPLTIPFFK